MKNHLGWLAAVLFLSAGGSAAAAAAVDGTFWYVIDHVTAVEEGAEALIWVTLPPVWHGQEVTMGEITPAPVAILDDPATGNRIIEWRLAPAAFRLEPGQEGRQFTFHYDFSLKELPVLRPRDEGSLADYDRQSADYIRYTAAEAGIQTDGRILDLARDIVGAEKDPATIGRKLYAWVTANLTFVPNGATDWDALAIRETREGNCDQFSTLLVALCRSVGIPARTVTNTWTWGDRHVFAELLMPDGTWLPADTALGQLLTAGRGGLTEAEVEATLGERKVPLGDAGWTYGNLAGNRLIISLGNNIRFDSPTLGKAITLQRMAPGGSDGHPAGYRLSGFRHDIVHGGFYVFGGKLDEEGAHRLAHQRLANHYFAPGIEDLSVNRCREANAAQSDGMLNWISLGKVYLHKGDYYKAEAAFNRAVRIGKEYRRSSTDLLVWAHNYLGNTYDLLSQRELATTQYTAAAALNNDFQGANTYALRYLGHPFILK